MFDPLYLSIATVEHSSASLPGLERVLFQLALFFKLMVEGIAVLVIALAVAITLSKLIRRRGRVRLHEAKGSIRLDLGLSLSLALEFLLAADILGTAISPSWDAIAKLAAVAGIRTFLNYFLHQEVRELEEETQYFTRENGNERHQR